MGKKLTQEEFIERSKVMHNDKYDYGKVEYANCSTKVCIMCPIHGEFFQKPNKHLHLCQGCPYCGCINSKIKQRNSIDELIKNFNIVHNNEYDYSKVEYVNNKSKICIICKEHGEFYQDSISHLHGQGCPKCYGTCKYLTDEWIVQAREIHNSKYDYSNVEYINALTKVCIICPIHGEFYQIPRVHLIGCGCPICRESTLERAVAKQLNEKGIEYTPQKRFEWLGLQSLDFYIELLHLAIECQGKQHFGFGGWGENYDFENQFERDRRKKELCEKHGIYIIYISESDYIDIGKHNFSDIYSDLNLINIKDFETWQIMTVIKNSELMAL